MDNFQQKLNQIKTDRDREINPVVLSTEQEEALSKLGEVDQQIEFVKELQRLNQKQLKLYSRAVRRRDYGKVE